MSSSSPSPTSDETPSERETQQLRDFVNEVTAIDRQASMSPRSAVLSHSSLRTGPIANHVVDPSSAVVDTRAHHRKRSKRRQPTQALELVRPSALSQLVDIDVSRKNPIDEVMRLRQILKTVEKHAVLEAQRATELQRANQEAQHRVQLLNETKLIAEQEAAKANQEKRLAQFQLDSAQKEIQRTQEAVKKAEREREEAEAEVARQRAKARKLHEQKLALAAREEGRRLGFEAGLQLARSERQTNAARKKPAFKPALKPIPIEVNPSSGSRMDKGKGKERAYTEDNGSSYPDHRSSSHPRNASTRHSMWERDDIISSPDTPEMSPSQLKLINLPPVENRSRAPSMHAGPSNSSPLRPFRPPTATHSEASERGAPPPNFQPFPIPQIPQPQPPPVTQSQTQPSQQHSPRPLSHAPLRAPSPEMDRWSLNIPSASQLDVSSLPIVTLPRDQWVTADKYLEKSSPPPQFPGGPPPMHIPPRQPPPANHGKTNSTPTKAVKFPLLSRPSLLKTKQQATSWYRSLSLRKKNKPVIDPDEPPTSGTTSAPTSAPLNTASTMDSQPQSGQEHPMTAELYSHQQPPPAMSWYQAKQPSVPAAPSMRSQYSKRRPTSDMMSVSTRVSQFDLLSTPYVAAQSVRSGKEGSRRNKEKDGYLSAIKENPFSRENTPSADRYLPAGSIPGGQIGPNGAFVTQPNFGQPSLHQRSSYATFESSGKRNSRRPAPPSIAVPDHDDVLEPAGAAYARHIREQNLSGADLARRPSKIPERTTPDTSIVIDVVPPSGFAADVPRSPPHTGINHLSPYHTYRPPSQASPRIAPMQSLTSLRTQGDTRVEPPTNRPGSVADSRRKSRQSLNTYTEPEQTSYFQPRPASRSSRAPNDNQYYQQSVRPESVRSSASRVQPLPIPMPNPQDTHDSSGQYLDRPNIARMKSSTSLRSVGSYSKYKPEEYVDPAFWSTDGPGELVQPQGGGGSMYNGRVPTRPPSANSDIYV